MEALDRLNLYIELINNYKQTPGSAYEARNRLSKLVSDSKIKDDQLDRAKDTLEWSAKIGDPFV